MLDAYPNDGYVVAAVAEVRYEPREACVAYVEAALA